MSTGKIRTVETVCLTMKGTRDAEFHLEFFFNFSLH